MPRASAPSSLRRGELRRDAEALLQSALAQAQGGTLFLDEIGELPGALQARLLHLLERGEAVMRAGEAPTPIDVRMVAASACSWKTRSDAASFARDSSTGCRGWC